MPHTLSAHLFCGHIHAAFFAADDLFAVRIFIFAALAGAVFRRPKDPLAEEAAHFGLERSVVDRFGLVDFAVRPLPDHFGRRQTNFNRIKIVMLHSN